MATYHSVELSASRGYGGGKAWIARITGRSDKFGFEREFVRGKESSSKSGKTGSVEATVTKPGLYECCDTDAKGKSSRFFLVGKDHEGDVIDVKLGDETAAMLADAMDAGRDLDDLRKWQDGSKVRGEDGEILWRVDVAAPAADPRADAVARIKALMAEHGITADDLR